MSAPKSAAKPLWHTAHEAALANLPRALVGMGFDRAPGPMPRGGVLGFEPAWSRRRLGIASRDEAAAMNRDKLRWPVRLAIRDADRLAVYVCTVTGQWRTVAGGAAGDDLAALAAMAWQQAYARSAYRLARICGVEVIPDVTA
jgi:hypothetical protein